MPNLKNYLSKLEIDGQLYDIKDIEAREAIDELRQTIEDNEHVTAAALNDLQNNKANKNEIPTKVSDLTNDSEFVTSTAMNELVETLTGMDADFATDLARIVEELEGADSEAANAWITLVDQLKGLGNKTEAVYYTQEEADAYNTEHGLESGDPGYLTTDDIKTPAVHYTQEEVDDANAELTGALNNSDTLTAEQAAAYNAAIEGATKEAGDTLTEEEANAYNATLEGAISTSDIKTEAVYYTQEEADAYNEEHDLEEGDPGYLTTSDIKTPAIPNTVKDYVDHAIESLPEADLEVIQDAIDAKLNANSVQTVQISQDTFIYNNEKLTISTTSVNVLAPVVTPVEPEPEP